MGDKILEECNVECISHFLDPIIDQSPYFARMELNSTKLLLVSMKLVTIN
ncbi:MAG: hypothetical protein ACTS8H_01750 [Arsenophonus sp. NC-PE1-MAG3]